MKRRISQAEMEAYLDEALPAERMAEMEAMLRENPALVEQLALINARRDSGAHSLGEIWRRYRVSCLDREQLGSYLLGALSDDESAYVDFHTKTIGCRICQANLRDLERQQEESRESIQARRTKYFQSSAGHLPRNRRS